MGGFAVKHVYLVTGSCPQTEAEARLAMAELREDEGNHESAAEWRAIVDRMREEWADRGPVGETRRKMARTVGPDPDALIPPLATPGHPMFWHEPRRDDTILCPCGHFATLLCDDPIGKAKTCDRPICACCTVNVGGFDRCDFHAATEPRQATENPPRPEPIYTGRPTLKVVPPA